MSARTTPSAGVGRTRGGLAWQPLRWSEGGLEAVPGLDFGSVPGRGRRIILRATVGAREGGWAARAAAAIAGVACAQGARVVLADLFLEQPHLHEVFDADNLEGVSDVVAYGASLGRVARAATGGAFRVVTAGTPTADAGALLDHPRWRRQVESLLDEGVTLVTYQPAESVVPAGGPPSIVLARKGEPMRVLGTTGLGGAVAVLGPPPGAAAAAAGGAGGGGTLADQGYRASLWEEVGDNAVSGEEPSPGGASGAAAEVEPSSRPAAEGRAAEPESARPRAAAAAKHSGADLKPSSVDGAGAAEAPPPAGIEAAKEVTGGGSGVRNRGLSLAAFAVLLLFATLMLLMGINNAGIAELPWADRLWDLFEDLLGRISGSFAR